MVGTASMFRMTHHGRPLVNGYSGHTPLHLSILASAIQRGAPTAILYFAEGRPLIVAVNSRFDADRWCEEFVRSMPGAQSYGISVAGHLFLIPPQPRMIAAPAGPQLQPVQVSFQDRDDLVVSLLAVDHAQTTDWPRVQKEASVSKRLFGEHADVHRILIAFNSSPARTLFT